jgi:hypothetical protein
MNARPEVKRVLIKKRMRYWLSIARYYPLVRSHCKPPQARRNFLRLLAKYPEIGEELGFSVVSVYTS